MVCMDILQRQYTSVKFITDKIQITVYRMWIQTLYWKYMKADRLWNVLVQPKITESERMDGYDMSRWCACQVRRWWPKCYLWFVSTLSDVQSWQFRTKFGHNSGYGCHVSLYTLQTFRMRQFPMRQICSDLHFIVLMCPWHGAMLIHMHKMVYFTPSTLDIFHRRSLYSL